MILSELGIIAEKFWREIPDHFPNIKLDEFIIMPDHIHGILIINRDYFVQAPNLGASTDSTKIILPGKLSKAPNLGTSTNTTPSESQSNPPVQAPNLGACTIENIEKIESRNPFWKSNSIGSIINQFKRICTITIKTRGFDFAWQPRFHDHIIRTRIELYRIRKYIRENPGKLIHK
jgi:hypothetical protein